jgi:hypothetical protein
MARMRQGRCGENHRSRALQHLDSQHPDAGFGIRFEKENGHLGTGQIKKEDDDG